MPTKAELYSQLASDTARRLTGNWERWAGPEGCTSTPIPTNC